MTDLELLEELKKIDTPTVTNVVATAGSDTGGSLREPTTKERS